MRLVISCYFLYCITLPNKLQKLLNLYFCNETLFIVHPCDQPNKSGCSDSCVKDGDNAKCNCSKNGFKLDSNGKTCCKWCIFIRENYSLFSFDLRCYSLNSMNFAHFALIRFGGFDNRDQDLRSH